MRFGIALYDALVSVNIQPERARSVVDALEDEMTNTLATKQDLLLVKQDMQQLKQELKQDMQQLKQELKRDIQLLEQRLGTVELRLTVKLGAMMAVGVATLFVLLKGF